MTKLPVILAASVLICRAAPQPGDLFREYAWTPQGNYHVLGLKQTPIALPFAVDLVDATRAEIALEIGNAHLGYESMALRVNDGEWHPISFPARTPRDPSPSLYFNQWYPVIPIALNELRSGARNSVLMRIGPEVFEGGNPHPAYTPVYGMTLRVYYGRTRKPYTYATIDSLKAGATIGAAVLLSVKAFGPVERVEYIGEYEDVNYQGDGVYRQWQYHLFRGRVIHNIGTPAEPGTPLVWDTSWTPDQTEPIKIAARVTNADGIVYFTQPIDGLLLRRSFHVELAKPFNVPKGFTACQYGVYVDPGPKEESIRIAGNVTYLEAARLIVPCWNCSSAHGFTLNGSVLQDSKPDGPAGSYHVAIVPVRELKLFQQGENRIGTIPGPGRMSDIHWPGIAALLRFTKDSQQAQIK